MNAIPESTLARMWEAINTGNARDLQSLLAQNIGKRSGIRQYLFDFGGLITDSDEDEEVATREYRALYAQDDDTGRVTKLSLQVNDSRTTVASWRTVQMEELAAAIECRLFDLWQKDQRAA